jgi:hypothetical protein
LVHFINVACRFEPSISQLYNLKSDQNRKMSKIKNQHKYNKSKQKKSYDFLNCIVSLLLGNNSDIKTGEKQRKRNTSTRCFES